MDRIKAIKALPEEYESDYTDVIAMNDYYVCINPYHDVLVFKNGKWSNAQKDDELCNVIADMAMQMLDRG